MHLFNRKAIVLFLAIALVLAFVPLGSVQAATKSAGVAQLQPEVWVGYTSADGVKNFVTIQEAVNAVAAEGTIRVNGTGGMYHSPAPITVNKPLTILGVDTGNGTPLINGKFILASQGATPGLLRLSNLRFAEANGAITIGDAAEANFDQVELSYLTFGATAIADSKVIQTASSVQIKDLKILYCTIYAAHGIELNGDIGSAAISDNTFNLTSQNAGRFDAITINQDTKASASVNYLGKLTVQGNTLNKPAAEDNPFASAILNQASFAMTTASDAKKLTASGNTFGAITDQTQFIQDKVATFVPVLPVKNVTTGVTYATIQAAVDAASDNNTIFVGAGNYAEQVTVNKPLTILGPNADKLGNASDRVTEAVLTHPDGLPTWNITTKVIGQPNLTIASDNVTIKGLKFTAPAYLQGYMPTSIKTSGANNVTIENNLFIDVHDAIAGGSIAHSYSLNWVIKGNKHDGGVFVNSRESHFINVTMVQMDVLNNDVSDVFFSVYHNIYAVPAKSGGLAGTISGNTFETSGVGVWHNDQSATGGKWVYQDNTFRVSPTTQWVEVDDNLQVVHRPFFTGFDLDYKAFYLNNNSGAQYELSHNIVNLANSDPNRNDRVFIESDDLQGDDGGMEGEFHLNQITNYTIRSRYVRSSKAILDTSRNWWGTANFATLYSQIGVDKFSPWCTDATCTSFFPLDGGHVDLTGNINVPGGIQINIPGLTFHLAPGTVIQNSSPCFVVNADDVKIYTDSPSAAKCVPTAGANGIDVAAGVKNLRVVNLEFDGASGIGGGTDGIHFAGAVDGFQLLNNFFHNFTGSGVVFTGTPTNNDGIAGNLFKNLGAAAIVVPAGLDPDLDAQYNAWGSMTAPTITDVNTSNNTHVALRIVTSGTFLADKLAVGQTLTATIVADLSNVTGADFILTYPTDLLEIQSVVNLSDMTLNRLLQDFPATGKLRFDGSVPFAAPIVPVTKTGKVMYKVTFVAKAAGTATLALDELTDLFAMSPSSGYSNHIYAYELVDKPESILIVADDDTPILESWLPLKGSTLYLNASKQLVLVVDASDSHLYELELDNTYDATDLLLPQFSVYADKGNPYGTDADRTQFLDAGVTVSYDATNQVWTINFGSVVTDRIINNHGGLITFYAVLKDEFGKNWGSMSPTTVDNTFAYTIVRDRTAPVLETWTPAEGQVILTPTGDFVLSVNALDANLYSLEINHNLVPTLPEFTVYASTSDPTGGHSANYATAGVTVAYNETTQTWTITFVNGGAALNAILAKKGITFYEVLKDMAGNELGSMNPTTDANPFAYQIYKQQPIAWDPSHTGGALTTTVSPDGNTINFTGPIAWYPGDSALGRTSGNRVGVEIKAPYLGFDTSLSTLTFDGTTYPWNTVKDGDNFVWVYPKVTAVPQKFTITVNWSATVSQVFTVNVLDTSTLVTPTGFTVQGTISMHGRVYRGDVPINLDGYSSDNYAITSQDKLGINYASNVVPGSYTFTTSQPRYLNVTADLNKTVAVLGTKTLAALTLRGGNLTDVDNVDPALSSKNKVDLADAAIIAGVYGQAGNTAGDANFDLIVNIQDLAMVGGNYNLTNTAAYGLWVP